MKIIENYFNMEGKYLDEIKIFGFKGSLSEITYNNGVVDWPIEYNSDKNVNIYFLFTFILILVSFV